MEYLPTDRNTVIHSIGVRSLQNYISVQIMFPRDRIVEPLSRRSIIPCVLLDKERHQNPADTQAGKDTRDTSREQRFLQPPDPG